MYRYIVILLALPTLIRSQTINGIPTCAVRKPHLPTPRFRFPLPFPHPHPHVANLQAIERMRALHHRRLLGLSPKHATLHLRLPLRLRRVRA